mmetsp:Transcript_19923/g.42551  ORF Transcript_19923/g.42551 Transcript_19923/m.42551 type:complete len:177 (-) Transcript_19923:192-722(-)
MDLLKKGAAKALTTAGDALVAKGAELNGGGKAPAAAGAAAATAAPALIQVGCPKCTSVNQVTGRGGDVVQCYQCGCQFQIPGGPSSSSSAGPSQNSALAGATAMATAMMGSVVAAGLAGKAGKAGDRILGVAVDKAASKATGGLIKEVPQELRVGAVDYLKKNPETAVKVAKMAMK